MKKVKKIPNCCSYNSPGFTYSQPFQTDAQMVLDLKLSYEHPPNDPLSVFYEKENEQEHESLVVITNNYRWFLLNK